MNKARTYEEMGAAFGVGAEEVAETRETRVEEMLPVWAARRREIVEKEGEY